MPHTTRIPIGRTLVTDGNIILWYDDDAYEDYLTTREYDYLEAAKQLAKFIAQDKAVKISRSKVCEQCGARSSVPVCLHCRTEIERTYTSPHGRD